MNILLSHSDQELLVYPSGLDGHSIVLPLTLEGLLLIRTILQARARGETKIGQSGAPTQAQIKDMIRLAKESLIEPRIVGKKREASLDLSLEDLDL